VPINQFHEVAILGHDDQRHLLGVLKDG
jgi:hypothetical protein